MTSAIPLRTIILAWVSAAIMCFSAQCLAAQPAPEQEKVVEALRLMYVAATNDDLDQFRAVTSSDFFTYDGGMRMSGDELMALIKDAHDAGKVYVWEVTEPQVHIDGQTAWVTYVNRGSLQDATGKKDLVWLESAVLRKHDDTWRIHFFHSTRVPSK